MVIGSDFEQRGESEEKKDALTDIIRKGLLAVSNIEDIEVDDYSLSSKVAFTLYLVDRLIKEDIRSCYFLNLHEHWRW